MKVIASVYYKQYDSTTSINWCPESEFNTVFIRSQEQYFNDKLRHRGHVFLNEVYDAFGLARTKAGALCGWWHAENGTGIKINVAGPDKDGAYVLDFNVEGVIFDRLPD